MSTCDRSCSCTVPDHPRVLPGGLTRFAIDEGAMVVNSSPERRIQGHMGAAMSRPLIGVTTSEMRLPRHTNPLPEGDPPQAEMALGIVYARAVERAGGLPVVLPPLDLERDRPAGRPPVGRLPVGRAGPRPGGLRRRPAPATSAPSSRRSTRSRSRSPATPTRSASRCSASAAAARRSTSRAAARCTSTCPTSRTARSTTARPRPGRETTHSVRDRAGLAAGRDRRRRASST